jgi:hypothetical protein
VFIKVVGMSFTEMVATNDWKPFQSCYCWTARLYENNKKQLEKKPRTQMTFNIWGQTLAKHAR